MLRTFKRYVGKVRDPILHRIRKASEARRIRSSINETIRSGSIITEGRADKPRLYIDITDVFLNDRGTGIQRVARQVSGWLQSMCTEYEVIEAYTSETGYRECRNRSSVSFHRGDMLFLLGYSFVMMQHYDQYIPYLLKNGVRVSAFLYDLIPVRYPRLCMDGILKGYRAFLKTAVKLPLVICDSKSVAEELEGYLKSRPWIKRNPGLKIGHSLLGCDFIHKEAAFSVKKEPAERSHCPSFLMVSTVEPRKMYAQAVRAFDLLWKNDTDAGLWIVGRPGWKSRDTISLIENHAELGKRLLWYRSGIPDGELDALYEKCDAVIFASVAEGFGLALAEGAAHKKPLILRDISVFREIAGEHAFYFSGEDAGDLASGIEEWLRLHEGGAEPKPEGMRLPTWKECSRRILELLTENNIKEV